MREALVVAVLRAQLGALVVDRLRTGAELLLGHPASLGTSPPSRKRCL